MQTSTDTFTITYSKGRRVEYADRFLTRPVLTMKDQMRYRVVVPLSYDLQNPWEGPFFYEDSRHVFFVTTTEQLVTIPMWNGYFPLIIPPKPDVIIPPMVYQPLQFIADPLGPIITGAHVGVVDTAPIERFVTEDTYIKKGIGTTGTVLFGGTEIGAVGNRGRFQQR